MYNNNIFGVRWYSSTGGKSPRVPNIRDRTCEIQVPTVPHKCRIAQSIADSFKAQ